MESHESQWLEKTLSRSLSTVTAPDELWSRVSAGLPAIDAPVRPRRRQLPHLAMAAAIAAVMTGGVLYLRALEPARAAAGLREIALAAHQGGGAAAPLPYAVQRYEQASGETVTVLSAAGATLAGPDPGQKHIRTTEWGALAISEWTSQGRTWVLVSSISAHKTACRVCHHA